MKSPFRVMRNQGTPIPLAPRARGQGLSFNLRGGTASMESYLNTYRRSGTINAMVGLLAESVASPAWSMYKKSRDARVRYSTADKGSDQRVEVVQHPALQLWNKPNDFHTGFTFREGANQHFELTGETDWVLDMEQTTFPTSMWYVRPDRMEPIPDPDNFLAGWIYHGPSGELVPLHNEEVIQEKRPDPTDPFRGCSPIASILANIEQQDFATQYQRNLFMNGATPGGIIMVPNKLGDREFDEMVDRWRESHQGVSRAGKIGILEMGTNFVPAGQSNKDMDYSNLRSVNREEMREAFRMHGAMMGLTEDINRANAETGEEVFESWQMIPRLDRRKDTLNNWFTPKFYPTGQSFIPVEFDYADPRPDNREEDNGELTAKANAASVLINAGYDPADVLEVVGLPDMAVVEKASQMPVAPPGWVPAPPAAPEPAPTDAQQKLNDELADILRGTWTKSKSNGHKLNALQIQVI